MGHLARFSGEFGGSGGSGGSGGNGGESRTDPEPLGSLGSSECSGAFEVSVVFSVGSEKSVVKNSSNCSFFPSGEKLRFELEN